MGVDLMEHDADLDVLTESDELDSDSVEALIEDFPLLAEFIRGRAVTRELGMARIADRIANLYADRGSESLRVSVRRGDLSFSKGGLTTQRTKEVRRLLDGLDLPQIDLDDVVFYSDDEEVDPFLGFLDRINYLVADVAKMSESKVVIDIPTDLCVARYNDLYPVEGDLGDDGRQAAIARNRDALGEVSEQFSVFLEKVCSDNGLKVGKFNKSDSGVKWDSRTGTFRVVLEKVDNGSTSAEA